MREQIVLFDGPVHREQVRVWLEAIDGGVRLCSQDVGPMAGMVYGADRLETSLTVEAGHLPGLVAALRSEGGAAARPGESDLELAIRLLADRYRGEQAATTLFRMWLEEHAIPFEFHAA